MVSVWSTINRGKYHHMALTHRVQYAYIVHVEYCACWILCMLNIVHVEYCAGPAVVSDLTERLGHMDGGLSTLVLLLCVIWQKGWVHGPRTIYTGPAVVSGLNEGLQIKGRISYSQIDTESLWLLQGDALCQFIFYIDLNGPSSLSLTACSSSRDEE